MYAQRYDTRSYQGPYYLRGLNWFNKKKTYYYKIANINGT